MIRQAVRREDLLLARQPFFRSRVARAWELIADALGQMERPCVALSGGKDSLCVAALVARVAPGTPAIWCDDELEYPAQESYIPMLCRALGMPLTVLCSGATHAGWFRAWQDAPYWRTALAGSVPRDPALPRRQYGAAWQRRAGYDGTFLGLRAQEASYRRTHLRAKGMLYQTVGGVWRANPLGGWGVAEVWALIAHWDLPYNPTYDTLAAVGVPRDLQRVGPLPLTYGSELRRGWPDLYRDLAARYGDRWYG